MSIICLVTFRHNRTAPLTCPRERFGVTNHAQCHICSYCGPRVRELDSFPPKLFPRSSVQMAQSWDNSDSQNYTCPRASTKLRRLLCNHSFFPKWVLSSLTYKYTEASHYPIIPSTPKTLIFTHSSLISISPAHTQVVSLLLVLIQKILQQR